jgi:hypothetical protein
VGGGEGNFFLSLARAIKGHKPLENQVSKTSFSGSHCRRLQKYSCPHAIIPAFILFSEFSQNEHFLLNFSLT